MEQNQEPVTVDPIGRMKREDGSVMAEASGVHRLGAMPSGAGVRWFETVMELWARPEGKR